MREIDSAMLALLRDRRVAISFSGGKDSLALWLALRRSGVQPVLAYYLYTVPDLSFVERYLCKIEQVFETEIVRLPHPSLVRMLRHGLFQAPDTYDAATEIPPWSKADVDSWANARADVQAIGARIHDSLVRRAGASRGAVWNESRHTCWPIWDWRTSDVIGEIQSAGVPLAVDYRLFGRSFDGIHYEYLRPIWEHYPDDFARIERYFPLIRAEMLRRDPCLLRT